MVRCKAFFNGLEVQVSFSMTRSPGVGPDIGQLVWRQGGALPESAFGDLVLKNGDTTIVTFYDCMLMSPREQLSGAKSVVYKVYDRRWKWKTPTLFGQYNVRDDANLLVAGTEKNARELALLALVALHAPDGGTFDVSALPTDAQLAPHVQWHYEPAASFLDKLCNLFGVSVQMLNDNSVKLVADNTGPEPDNTGLMLPVENGLITNPAPNFISAYAGDTLFESWLATDDIGMELDGTVKPISMLSYAPTGGWAKGDPKYGYTAEITGKLRGTLDQELIDKTIEIANRTVYRMKRVIGFPAGQDFFPGITVEASVESVGDLPAEGDKAKVYQIDDGRTVIWTGTEYIGVTYSTGVIYWTVIDPAAIPNIAANPRVDTGERTDMETALIAAANPTFMLVPPNITVVDQRLLLPLLGSRIESALNELGQRARKPAEVCGIFLENDDRVRNKITTKLAVWKHGFRIDTTKGHVTLGQPAYQKELGVGVKPAEIYVRCAYGYRQKPYASRYHRRYDKATGNNLGVANAVVNRTDINEYRIQAYGSDYNDLSILDPVVNNTSAVDLILEDSATEHLKQYQNFVAPKRKQYTPFRAIDTNGKVLQVTYQGGRDGVGMTIASIGGNFDLSQPPAKQKRLQELQKQRAEFALQDFRAQGAVIGNMNGNGINGISTADIA